MSSENKIDPRKKFRQSLFLVKLKTYLDDASLAKSVTDSVVDMSLGGFTSHLKRKGGLRKKSQSYNNLLIHSKNAEVRNSNIECHLKKKYILVIRQVLPLVQLSYITRYFD